MVEIENINAELQETIQKLKNEIGIMHKEKVELLMEAKAVFYFLGLAKTRTVSCMTHV